ncbi:MAG: hypothetical protein F4Z87_00100 [Gammaproteobacteria bacterium]|nr:hypothetical protein [Gammaproteobacteria bacterium]
MINRTRLSYTLCGALVPFLCASVNAEEDVAHSMEVSDKILLMETIHVSSNKDIADEDESSGDPEVDQILNLADSLTLSSDESTDESASVESDEVSDRRSEDASDQATIADQMTDKVDASDSSPSKPQKTESKTVSDKNTNENK